MVNGLAISLPEAGPRLRRYTMARRVGSDSAWNTRSRVVNWLGICLSIVNHHRPSMSGYEWIQLSAACGVRIPRSASFKAALAFMSVAANMSSDISGIREEAMDSNGQLADAAAKESTGGRARANAMVGAVLRAGSRRGPA